VFWAICCGGNEGKLEKQKALLSDHAKERDPLYKEGMKIATYLILV
jgi:hypothetical protein